MLSACSSIKKAGVVYQDSFGFSTVKSYSLYDRNSPFSETQSLLDTRRNGKWHEYANYNKMVRFCTQCLRATTWRTEQQYVAISQGSLVVDLIDPKQNRSVWRSVHPLGLKTKENSADTNDRIKLAVSTMLAQYPS